MRKPPTVCVDLDGVLNLYDGWRGEDHWPDPRPGAWQFLTALARDYSVVVLTTRPVIQTWAWLEEHGLEDAVYEVTNVKRPAVVYIDDRAVGFRGDYDQTLQEVRAFRAHWERATEAGDA